ncbi:MAG: MarR family winged helix-turn-helix transcriptional regulator, partial [Candidatus Limnocylindria bacterium]
AHRRARLVKLSATGRRTLTRIQAAQTVWADDLGAQLGAANLQEANAVLGRALATLSRGRFQVSGRPG